MPSGAEGEWLLPWAQRSEGTGSHPGVLQVTKAVGWDQETWMPQEAQTWRSESTKAPGPSQPLTVTEPGTREHR